VHPNKRTEKRHESIKRESWLKMLHEEIVDQQQKVLMSHGAWHVKGTITDIIKKFKVGLPWLNFNAYHYCVQQLKGRPYVVTKTDMNSVSNVSGLTTMSPVTNVNKTDANNDANDVDADEADSSNINANGIDGLSDNVSFDATNTMDTNVSHAMDLELSLSLGGGATKRNN
jgi:hypothetical protein